MSDAIIIQQRNHIAHIILNRPAAENRIDEQLAQQVKDACTVLRHDNLIFAVVLTGSGEKAFCSGAEAGVVGLVSEIAAIEQPVIAAINGDALGEGLELALACDIRIASHLARFGLPQVGNGYLPREGGTQRLPRLVGRGKAMELVLTGEIIGAEEAWEIGLIEKVVMSGNLGEEVEALANTMATKSPVSLRYAKETILKGMDLTLDQGLRLEADLYMLLHTTADRIEGIRAFQEKRRPHFEGK